MTSRLGARETQAQRVDESCLRGRRGDLGEGKERGTGKKRLARDGTRWPSGARSTRPQPDCPDLWRRRAGNCPGCLTSYGSPAAAAKCMKPPSPPRGPVRLAGMRPGTGGRRSPRDRSPLSLYRLPPCTPLHRLPDSSRTTTFVAALRQCSPAPCRVIFESGSTRRLPRPVSKRIPRQTSPTGTL